MVDRPPTISYEGVPRQEYYYSGNDAGVFAAWVLSYYDTFRFQSRTDPGEGTGALNTNGDGIHGEDYVTDNLPITECDVYVASDGSVQYRAQVDQQIDATIWAYVEWWVGGQRVAYDGGHTPTNDTWNSPEWDTNYMAPRSGSGSEVDFQTVDQLASEFGEGQTLDAEARVWIAPRSGPA